jgi:hypothetical protein
MRTRRALPALVVVLLAAAAIAQEAAQELPPLMIPTPFHREMARDVGVWDAETTTWATPDAAPETGKGSETNEMLGGMWLLSHFQGEFMSGEFHGRAQIGYDPLKKKYVGTWVDSISPFLFTMEGDYDVAAHTLTMMMNGTSAMTGQPETAKNVTRYIDDDNKVFEMHMPVEGQEGQWWKMMEIKYTRRR